MKLYFDDEDFDGQLQRSIGKADSGMANVGECLAIAGQITPGDRDSWYRAWSGFATHLAEQGQAALAAGHRVSARSVLLRASEYFRQAFFYHRDNLDGAELQTAYASNSACLPKPKAQKDTAKAWHPSSSGPPPSTGWTTCSPEPMRSSRGGSISRTVFPAFMVSRSRRPGTGRRR
jgi:hypothetical protein